MENEGGWEVALDYQVIPGRALEAVIYDEETYEVIEPRKHYEPFVCRELPAKFAQLRLDDEQGVLAFAGTYGLLGYGDLERIGLHRSNEPEPLAWWWAHAATVRMILTLRNILMDNERDADAKLMRLLEEGIQATDPSDAIAMGVPARDGSYFIPFAWHRDTDNRCYYDFFLPGKVGRRPAELMPSERVEVGWTYLTDVLSRNLERVHRVVNPPSKRSERVEVNWTTHSLLETIYSHVADVLEGKVGYRTCNRCGAWFESRHGHQRYCPPVSGVGGSACAQAARDARRNRSKTRPKSRRR